MFHVHDELNDDSPPHKRMVDYLLQIKYTIFAGLQHNSYDACNVCDASWQLWRGFIACVVIWLLSRSEYLFPWQREAGHISSRADTMHLHVHLCLELVAKLELEGEANHGGEARAGQYHLHDAYIMSVQHRWRVSNPHVVGQTLWWGGLLLHMAHATPAQWHLATIADGPPAVLPEVRLAGRLRSRAQSN